jgi:two-component system sensor histidine kinase and response regulator WspE
MSTSDLSQFSMLDLFRVEVESQGKILTDGLLALEREPAAAKTLEACMRAAHSLKGAARIVNLNAGVRTTHVMEDCFVAAQRGKLILQPAQIDVLLRGVDLLTRIAQTDEASQSTWEGDQKDEVDSFVNAITEVLEGRAVQVASVKPLPSLAKPAPSSSAPAVKPVPQPQTSQRPAPATAPASTPSGQKESADRVLRVTAEHLNRLLGLTGESMVESHRLEQYGASLHRLKRLQNDLGKTLDRLRDSLPHLDGNSREGMTLLESQRKAVECREFLAARLAELELFNQRSTNLSHRLYSEALDCRMRPFADGVQNFPRMVRDLARTLGKEAKLIVIGETTTVDRDVLDRLETPLAHLLRNAVDHGIEPPGDRLGSGKNATGTVRLEASHRSGVLHIQVSDDGRGITPEKLRRAVVEKKLASEETAAQLSEAELLEFLFLPGFTTKETVTETSGRGVGLDIVQTLVRQLRGAVRVFSKPGLGTRFELQLPLTLSVVRTLLVEIAGEAYAFPLAFVNRTLKLPRAKLESLEGRQHFQFEGQPAGLVTAHQVLGRGEGALTGEELPVVVLGGQERCFGLMVDKFLGERELVVHPLDSRLGKMQDISAGSLLDDGSPVLIVDVEDMTRSVEKMISIGQLGKVRRTSAGASGQKRKRILVVDDSFTVRELERKLLENSGYAVEVAVDGMDGWNAVRAGRFDLVISDVDMPRMDGIEMISLLKRDHHLRSLPAMIVSYKDREEDRRRGLDAGADYYLAKATFNGEVLLGAVADLIGGPTG